MKTHFNIFEQPVELLVLSQHTGGAFSVGRQTCEPGTGTPPHRHEHEDEVFSVVSGRFEIYNGDTNTWTEIPQGGIVFAPRHHVHCFRNCGDVPATIQFVCGGDRFDTSSRASPRTNSHRTCKPSSTTPSRTASPTPPCLHPQVRSPRKVTP